MTDIREQLFARAAVDGRRPADRIRAKPEKRDDLAIQVGAGMIPAFHPPAVRAVRAQRGRRCRDALRSVPVFAHPLPACPPTSGVPVGVSGGRSNCSSFAHAYLAAMDDPVARVGEGAHKGVWNFDSSAFEDLSRFVHDLSITVGMRFLDCGLVAAFQLIREASEPAVEA